MSDDEQKGERVNVGLSRKHALALLPDADHEAQEAAGVDIFDRLEAFRIIRKALAPTQPRNPGS